MARKSVAEKVGAQKITQEFKGERALKKGVKRMKKRGYIAETIDEEGKPWYGSFILGVAKRYQVTFVKQDE